jgi:hypothetical protein
VQLHIPLGRAAVAACDLVKHAISAKNRTPRRIAIMITAQYSPPA